LYYYDKGRNYWFNGSGKSYISNLFSKNGVPIYNSDIRALYVINNNLELRNKVIELLGDVYDSKGLDTDKVRSLVFQPRQDKMLKKYNSIVHPFVFR
jgi:dephospho-CoA kinase